MPKLLTQLSVFISCPSDVSELRRITEAAVRDVSVALMATKEISLNAIVWNIDIVPGVSIDPQQVINTQTLGKYDIYIGLLASRFGVPTSRAGSGTEEEFNLALEMFSQDTTSIRLLMYFQAFGINPFAVDPDQLQRVQNFRKSLGGKGVLYRDLSDLDDALASIKAHLLKVISEEWDSKTQSWSVATSPSPGARADSTSLADEVVAQEVVQESSVHSEEFTELGLFDKFAIGVSAIQASGEGIQGIGAALRIMTERSSSRLVAIASGRPSGIASLQEAINLYASDMDVFVADSRSALVSAKYNLLRGADFLEAFYKEATAVGFTAAESPSDLAQTITATEPSLKDFRNSIQSAKQVVLNLPPYTATFRTSRNNCVAFFDELSSELTICLERLRLLRDRLTEFSPSN